MEDTHGDEAFVLRAIDGYPLAASLFEPQGPARGTLIIHGATATPQRFYRSFARFLAEGGVRVVTYDYRGVGRSRPASLRGFHATMTEWARLDARAAHRHVSERHGTEPIAILGHSFGGQLVGLIDEPRASAGAIFVGAQFGYYGHWPLLQQPRLAVTWHALVPFLTATVGYLPGKAGLGEDLPRGVAEEWRRWCTHPGYLLSSHPDAAARFAKFDVPTAFYSFTDDSFGPRGGVKAFIAHLPAARLDHRRIDPRDLAKGPIGHFGFFRSRVREPLWDEALAFLTDVFEGRRPRTAPKRGPRSWDVREADVLADLLAYARQARQVW